MKKGRRVDPALIWLAVMLLLALGLRVYRLDAQSLWYDEAVTAQVARLGIGELTRWTADDIQPPLYYYAVAGWTRLAGRSEWALRFPSAFFGVLTVALLWAAARRIFGRGETGRWAAGMAALLAATLPLYVYYAQEARMYTLLTFLGVLAGYALLRARHTSASPYIGTPPENVMPSSPSRERALRAPRQETPDCHPERVNHSKPVTARPQRRISSWEFLGSGLPIQRRSQRNLSEASQRDQRDPSLALSCHLSCVIDPLRVTGEVRLRTESSTWWVVFVLASVAMLYTHYFGVFLLIAYGVCWLVWCKLATCTTKLRSLAAFGISVLTIILLYLPWLPAMLNRYRADASYWQGALKLGEALRHVAINFTAAAPEMMLEDFAVRLLPVYGVAVALALIALFWRGRYAGQAGILLAVLILPVIAVLLLASRTPKFNPRYLMLASPAYLLILAGGIGALWRMADGGWQMANGRWRMADGEWRMANGRWRMADGGWRMADGGWRMANGASRTTHHREAFPGDAPRITHHASRITLLLLIVFLLATSLVSLRNWFTDPAFTKAQWRELAAFVRAERAPDEAVLLVSGHAYPAWDYYAADIPVVRLPASDILDVNAVLGFELGPTLTQALAGQRGAWLVTWQDEVADPVGFVPYFLERGGQEQTVPRQFWHLGLRHWRLDPAATFPAEPQPEHPDAANFDHKLALLGWDDPAGGQITVYWRVLNTLPADYQVSLAVEDAAGRELGRWDGRPASYDYPTFRWQPGLTLFGRYPLPAAPAGDYFITLAVYEASDPAGLDLRDVADNPAGKRVRFGPVGSTE